NNTLNLLKKDNIIYKKNSIEAGYVETRQLKIDSTGQEYIIVNGKFLTNYFDRRINWGIVNFNGTVENLMRKLVEDNCINPSNINRKIKNLELGLYNNFKEIIEYQNSYGYILNCLENISKTSDIGFVNRLDIKNKKIIFELYKGANRTVNGDIAPCIFSRDFENILEQGYFESNNNYKNTCLIAGCGEGLERKITSIETNKIGLDRYEMYIDARDIQDTKEVEKEDNDGNITTEQIPIPLEEYNKLLTQRGQEKLKERKEIETFESTVNSNGNNVYKVDYDLGDMVTVVDKKWGIKVDSRITEIAEIYENENISVIPVFGNNIPTLLDKIKQKIS
ncbi:siphovirus ReqiPepy6 Gp37-like family protein, partial [Clostridium senegalense]|uniref:siphovirus ReqiPepy6 Gp37-like family protein n=1 Tax=Clostridium senegalense TaxID=1465809 RepID=UPI000288B741